MADYDLAIIGGGLNGVCMARDAAGRGLRVILLEQGDLAGAASSATSRLIHGDLAVLERRRVRRVRAALAERTTWLAIAPHLVRPWRFAIPAHADERTPGLLRLGLLLYDRLGPRSGSLPASETLDVTHHPLGVALKRPFGTIFEYSDCLADDSRLVVLTAVDAAARGADIRTGARCVRIERGSFWRLSVVDRGHRRPITTRALALAAGAWTPTLMETLLRMPPPRAPAVQVSQIIVPRLFDPDNVYVLQNSDQRLIYASPFERDFTLIGSVSRAFKGDPAIVAVDARDVAYLCDAASRYFRDPLSPSDVIRTVSGANLVAGTEAEDGAISFDAKGGKAPLIAVLGGGLTTARRRAERAVSRLTPFYPMTPRWTAQAPLPGGAFAWDKFENEVDAARERWPFLTEPQAQRLVGAYGTQLADVLGEAKDRAALGPAFGSELTAAEVRYLMAREWARFPEDVLWRRTKLGLTMQPADRDALAAFMADATPSTTQAR
ncbi:glycerol-3-phosphate dehydrogenase [Bradyrhizobium sp. NP1]|uniref:glycerol-3-phosphate dehydrogenase n=1 Tax=Bradyrhizobium sp. NP1 TaxID=3049772 RepID=UPI0025A63987|nr:glycerol-3-phosphate dehydrogenase [Bradyrhizobium sp. NP1]WJR77517.1 glycerol-3-phosphate dehydrogenase [Bradyrhizobium sp. NP1]